MERALITHRQSRSLAIISGKGGSGKTMVSAVIAETLAMNGPTLLIDGDTGTGGMTYYLGMEVLPNTAAGLSDLVALTPAELHSRLESPPLQPVPSISSELKFLGVGNHRALYGNNKLDVPAALSEVIKTLEQQFSWTIVDCRGGIDQESLAVCSACDDILLVVETDTTSYQASLHVVDILNGLGLASKLRGFIINKVFEDPSIVARTGTGNFRTRALASIPLDISATRRFLVGRLPDRRSPFSVHVRSALSKAYPDARIVVGGTIWSDSDYDGVKLSTVDSMRGGIVLLGLTLLLTAIWLQQWLTREELVTRDRYFLMCALLLSICSDLESVRRMLGRGVESYFRTLSRLLSRPPKE